MPQGVGGGLTPASGIAGSNAGIVTIKRHLPKAGDDAWRLCGQIILVTGATWVHAQPSDSVLAAYKADPSPAYIRMDFTDYLETTVAALVSGTLAQTA